MTDPLIHEISLSLPSGEKIVKFASNAVLKKWVNKQLGLWGTLSNAQNARSFNDLKNHFGGLVTNISQYEETEDEGTKNRLRSAIITQLRDQRIKVIAGSKDANFLKTVAGESPIILEECYLLLIGQDTSGNHTQIKSRAYYRVGEYFERGRARATAPVRQSLENLETRFKTSIEELEQRTDNLNTIAKIEIQNTRNVTAAQIKASRKVFSKSQAAHHKTATDSVAMIEETDNRFKSQMELAAPSDYWKCKAAQHERAEDIAKKHLINYLVFIIAVLIGILFVYANKLASMKDLDVPLYATVILLGLAGTLSTIAFWIGRVMTRIYLSEHHLAIDAHERSVMATTYLALIDNQGADKEDRSLVLTALFRPTADGVIKDDAAPIWNLQSIVSGALSKQTP